MWGTKGDKGMREETVFLATTDGAVAVDQATDTERSPLQTPNAQAQGTSDPPTSCIYKGS